MIISHLSPFNLLLVSHFLSMGQSFQEWTKRNLWKTAFKKLEGCLQADHITLNFLKAVLHKFHWVHP